MTTREKAPTGLTRRQAAQQRRLVIGNALEVADEEMERALVERDWETLGFDSWESYCASFPGYQHFRMKAGPRRERVRKLRAKGATIPQMAAATGASIGSVHGDLKALEGGHNRAAVSTLKEEDPPALTAEVIAELTNWQAVLRRVRQAGDAGLTCQEFEAATGWGHGKASAAFHACERKGYVRRLDGVFRGAYAVYVTVAP